MNPDLVFTKPFILLILSKYCFNLLKTHSAHRHSVLNRIASLIALKLRQRKVIHSLSILFMFTAFVDGFKRCALCVVTPYHLQSALIED